jgi:hypothetical protein
MVQSPRLLGIDGRDVESTGVETDVFIEVDDGSDLEEIFC